MTLSGDSKPDECLGCGGSGHRSDQIIRDGEKLTDEQIEMLDDNRCTLCHGDGLWKPGTGRW